MVNQRIPPQARILIVVEFTDPEMANAIIYAGMVWEGPTCTSSTIAPAESSNASAATITATSALNVTQLKHAAIVLSYTRLRTVDRKEYRITLTVRLNRAGINTSNGSE